MIVWMVVNRSMSVNKTVSNIPVRVVNLAAGKTIEGMEENGLLKERISLSLYGNKTALDDLSERDLEIILDVQNQPDEWKTIIGKKEIISLNPDFNPSKSINKVTPVEKTIIQSKLISEKIPVMVSEPIGQAPKGYQYLDIWPYQLSLTVTGPEAIVKKLKNRGGLKYTLNLSDLSKGDLDSLQATQADSDEVSFPVPASWKKITIPELSSAPLQIDDPQAIGLKINFSRQNLLPLQGSIPITVFFPNKYASTLNPDTYSLATNEWIVKKNGIKVLNFPLFAHGVSRTFLDVVKERIEVVIVAAPKSEREYLLWNTQFVYPQELENKFITKMMMEGGNALGEILPHLREDYLRNRFRSYMQRLRLYTPDSKKLSLKIELQANNISITPTQR
jgi:hypothetical protein